ncbi:MAG: hypothetical protein WA002_16695, partial [Candidatus Acidiferrales bacterium]
MSARRTIDIGLGIAFGRLLERFLPALTGNLFALREEFRALLKQKLPLPRRFRIRIELRRQIAVMLKKLGDYGAKFDVGAQAITDGQLGQIGIAYHLP